MNSYHTPPISGVRKRRVHAHNDGIARTIMTVRNANVLNAAAGLLTLHLRTVPITTHFHAPAFVANTVPESFICDLCGGAA
ncbi:hypothetical protein [Dokdonella soli]|uniref:hypothetical protein n=1 Tax=Dokdonella soli TaxID=529810 RepID=UPI0031E21620